MGDVSMLRRTANLLIAGAITAIIYGLGLYLIAPQRAYTIYRCLEGAESPLNCTLLNKPTNFRTTTLGSFYEGNTEDEIDRSILALGAFEKPEMFFLRDVSTGGVFIDVGANKGLYSIFLSQYQKQVHAFEPYQPVLEKFRALVARNRIQNIIIHPVGLGDKHEFKTFEEPAPDNMGMGSFAFLSNTGSHKVLEIVRGDEILERSGVRNVDIVKIDIEGFERPALAGLKEIFNRSRPVVLFELTLKAQEPILFKSMDEIARAFPPEYEFKVLKKRDPYTGAYELVPTDGTINFTGVSEQHNVVAFPKEKANRVPLKRL